MDTRVDFEGHRFRFAAPLRVAWAVRSRGGIENGICRLVLAECGPGAVAFDVGANYGFVTLVMASAVGKAGRVHSFEADPVIANALAANVTENDFTMCSPVRAFVSDASDGAERISIDDYVRTHAISRVDFIKIDVDGPDLQVLRGAQQTLARFKPVVVVELTSAHAEIVQLLRSHDYECTDMQGQDIDPEHWPANLFASVGRRLRVPPPRAAR